MIIAIAFVLVIGLLLIAFYAIHRGRPVEFDLDLFGAAALHLDTKNGRPVGTRKAHAVEAQKRPKSQRWLAWIGILVVSVWQWLTAR